MNHHDQAQQFLRKAAQDVLVIEKLRLEPDIATEILGFHAQQAAEKILKAVLAERLLPFPYTHRLADLMDMLSDNGTPVPAAPEDVRDLTPFAVQFRYDSYTDTSADCFDAAGTLNRLEQLRTWAAGTINP